MSRNLLLFLVPLVFLFFGKTEADLFFKIQFEIKNTIESNLTCGAVVRLWDV